LKEPPVAGIDLPLISLAGVPKQKGRERWGIQPWIMLSFLALEVISPPPPPLSSFSVPATKVKGFRMTGNIGSSPAGIANQ